MNFFFINGVETKIRYCNRLLKDSTSALQQSKRSQTGDEAFAQPGIVRTRIVVKATAIATTIPLK